MNKAFKTELIFNGYMFMKKTRIPFHIIYSALQDFLHKHCFYSFLRIYYYLEKSIFVGYVMEYITAKEAAEKWDISQRRVQVLCEQGRIAGAVRLGWAWAIPKEIAKPMDARKKNCNS